MRETLTGSRIRERRIAAGLKQADLARQAGISASYLNLIEHNRRRIGGKLLLDIAEVLQVEAATLAEGAEATLIAGLREAASDMPQPRAELDRVDEFAGRFPGWAALLMAQHKRIATLERTVTSLTDRLTHDPHLAASLHEMLSTVTAIRSTASILAEPGEIAPEWQARFHRNINEDSARLAETSQALVRYLDEADDADVTVNAPQEELDAVLARHRHNFPQIERGEASPQQVVASAGEGLSSVAQRLFIAVLEQLQHDVDQLDAKTAIDAMRETGCDPFALAQACAVPVDLAMRRIAVLAPEAGQEAVALAVCDASGALVYRQPLDQFPLARFGAGCAMLPLYRALSQPMLPIVASVRPTGRLEGRYTAYAMAQPYGAAVPNRPSLVRSTMLIVPELTPADTVMPDRGAAIDVGVSCRICSKERCPARREPSILSRGF